MTRPLRSAGITPLQRYYGAVRAWTAHRYFRPRGSPLVPFPLSSPTRVSSSEQKPGLESRLLYTGHRMDSKQVSSMPLPKLGHHSGFDVIFGFSMLHQRFACARLSHPYMTQSKPRLLTMTLPSRPEEFHLEPLTDPDLTLSRHPARAIARRLPPSIEHRVPPVAG